MQAVTFSCTIFMRHEKINTLFYDTFTILLRALLCRTHRLYSVRFPAARIVS